MKHRQAISDDLITIKELLSLSNLPADDCAEHLEHFVVMEDEGKVIGLGGLENCGAYGLLRSIVVAPEYRGNGIAKMIYSLIEKKAYDLGINTLYLLTESATEYFEKLGFVIQQRSEVPLLIVATKQFKQLCPASAVVMFREISERKG